MASTFAVTRNHLIFGLCLPLAVLLGYMLADIDDPASRLVILIALGVLAVPILMRWHHLLLILSWNMVAQPALPGSPHLWSIMAIVSLFFAILNRSVNADYQFAHVPQLTRPLMAFGAVVVITMLLTGGIGLRIFGSTAVGGRGYVYILTAIAGFFALSCRSIPRERVGLYVALFFLPGLTSMVGQIAGWFGPGARFVGFLFPLGVQSDDFVADSMITEGMVRISGSVAASFAIVFWLLARFGVAGIFDFTKPWRLLLFLGSMVGLTFGGFRSSLLLTAGVFLILFSLEKLWRTRLFFFLLTASLVAGIGLAAFADRLPLPVQRTLSFLPIKVDPLTREMADSSTQWRVDMWKAVLPEVPRYLLKGKGYNYSADELFMAQMNSIRAGTALAEEAAFAGDYHNGPLSVIIPFGAAGMLAFIWLIVAGARFLYSVYSKSPPELLLINRFILALFLARVLFFFFIFGSLINELCHFTGLLGFSVALNLAARKESVETEPAVASPEAA
jgi:hypothetical protein